ncbi:hypothetical protein RHOSPDRAFT_35462 [Rhodotorula sp. JG-1b]|nr:hypothetical protein RHOSPDRAFT_35462 [Rhodotorula sp. JG-1b]
MVLSSASESGSEGEGAKSRFFADSVKRKRAASPPPIEWASMGLKGISPLDGTKRSSEPAVLAGGAPPVLVRATSTTSSSSFVSALELLRASGSPPESDESDLEPLKPLKSVRASSTVPKPRRQKLTVKAKRAASASSSEPISTGVTNTGLPDSRPAKRRSVSPLSSSEGEESQPLPAPDLWAKRFSRGSSSATAAAVPDPSDAEPTTTTSTTQTRAKPWEALEAKIGKVKKPPTRTTVSRQSSLGARTRSTSLVPAAKKEEEDHSSDSDVIVTSSLPARARSRSSSTARPKPTRSRPPLDFLPPPVELPPEEVVRVLTLCALCSVAWPASKTLAAKQGHLRSCASKNDYTAETVRYLVEKQVLELADAAEQDRRALDDGKTLFDRAVGKGEGAHAMRDVTVVGVEGLESAAGVEWFKATTEVQAEIDRARRKVQVAKVIKVAKQIRLDQRARARDAKETAAASDDDGLTEDVLVMPESTGRLQPAAATLVTARADAVLARLDSDDAHSFAEALPSTQEFQQSRLLGRTTEPAPLSGSNTPSTPPPPPPRADGASRCETASDILTQSRSPFRQLSLPDPRSGSISRQGHPPQHRLEREIESCSLWQLAAGRDDARLDTVVLKKPSHLASVPVSPRRRLTGPAQQHQQRQSSLQSDHGRDENACSSEEEALARVVERNKSSPKKRRRARSPASSSESDLPTSPSRIVPSRVGDTVAVPAAAPAPTLPGMPEYESLAVTTLQRKVRQYGFRASKEKDVLVAQLRQVWIAMHPAPPLPVPDGGEAAETDASGGKTKKGAASTDSPSPNKKTTASKAKATTAGRGRAKVKAKSKDDDENASDLEIAAPEADSVPGSTVGEKLRHLIVHDEGLYCRILRYEPIHIDEFAALANANGVKIARPLLTRFLDEQSITHYSQDPTGGTRRRYR